MGSTAWCIERRKKGKKKGGLDGVRRRGVQREEKWGKKKGGFDGVRRGGVQREEKLGEKEGWVRWRSTTFDGVVYREKKKLGRRRRESEREKKSEIKKPNYYFIIKINNILIKLTSLFFVRGGDALVYYCSFEWINALNAGTKS